MAKQFDALVFIGRFQPLHLGHQAVIDKALSMAEKVIVLVGSANLGRSSRNPFTFAERRQMILQNYGFADLDGDKSYQNLVIEPLDDIMYNDLEWVEQTQATITKIVLDVCNDNANVHIRGMNDLKIGLIGCKKDATGYYLDMFPNFESVNVEQVNPEHMLNSTEIRGRMFMDSLTSRKVGVVTFNLLLEAMATNWFLDLREEYLFVKDYKETVKQYPRIEHTTDAVVIQSGHVLLIRRRAKPGKGKWALPGGFVNPEERLIDSAIRELQEETKIKVPDPVLRGSIKTQHTYDDPHRSSRGRLITNAYLIVLPNARKFPKVIGSDDADKARWIPMSDLKADELFEDHYFIIHDLIKRA